MIGFFLAGNVLTYLQILLSTLLGNYLPEGHVVIQAVKSRVTAKKRQIHIKILFLIIILYSHKGF